MQKTGAIVVTWLLAVSAIAAPVKSIIGATSGLWDNGELVPIPYWGLCFTAEEPGVVVNMSKSGSPPSVTLETSFDGRNWSYFDPDGTTPISLENVGDFVYFRAGSGGNTQFANAQNTNYRSFVFSKRTAASGNIMSILDGKDKNNVTLTARYCFEKLFYQCTTLTSAPELPALNLSENCYDYMFYGCKSLAIAPELPSTMARAASYEWMFGYCSSLVKGPSVINITTNAREFNCASMFFYCTSLEKAPKLNIKIGGIQCELSHMFYGCSKLKEVEVTFDNWGRVSGNSATCINWMVGVATTGIFRCPKALGTQDTIARGSSRCPTGWTVENTD